MEDKDIPDHLRNYAPKKPNLHNLVTKQVREIIMSWGEDELKQTNYNGYSSLYPATIDLSIPIKVLSQAERDFKNLHPDFLNLSIGVSVQSYNDEYGDLLLIATYDKPLNPSEIEAFKSANQQILMDYGDELAIFEKKVYEYHEAQRLIKEKKEQRELATYKRLQKKFGGKNKIK